MEYDLEKISSKVARKNAIKKIIKKVFSIFLIIIAIINIILLVCMSNGEENPSVFGIYFYNIVSRKYATYFRNKRYNIG